MKKYRLALIGLAFLLFIGTFQAMADMSPPRPFTRYSDNGMRVFRFDPRAGEPRGTVYSRGKQGEQIYALDLPRYTYHNSLFFSADMRHLILLHNQPPFSALEEEHIVLEFFEYGNLIQRYYADDLVETMGNLCPETGTSWAVCVPLPLWIYPLPGSSPGRVHFSPETNTLSVITIDEITYTFDITTGEILPEYRYEQRAESAAEAEAESDPEPEPELTALPEDDEPIEIVPITAELPQDDAADTTQGLQVWQIALLIAGGIGIIAIPVYIAVRRRNKDNTTN